MPAKRVVSSNDAHRRRRSWSSTNKKYDPYDDTLHTKVLVSSRCTRYTRLVLTFALTSSSDVMVRGSP